MINCFIFSICYFYIKRFLDEEVDYAGSCLSGCFQNYDNVEQSGTCLWVLRSESCVLFPQYDL